VTQRHERPERSAGLGGPDKTGLLVRAGAAVSGWWFAPQPLGRVAALRVLAYLFIPFDMYLITYWAPRHAAVPGEFYRPLEVARVLRLPDPTATLVPLGGLLLVLAAVGAALLALLAPRISGADVRRAARLDVLVRALGLAVALLYLWWMVVAMSYGKVDHDRFAFLVLLFVLPTVAGARLGDRTTTQAAGWGLRAVQVSVVLTYFLAAIAKIRFGGFGWVNSGTYARAVIRRGSMLVDWTLQVPAVLVAFQWFTVIFELASPVLLFLRSERVRLYLVLGLYGFHAMTFLALGIAFWPHLVALAAFLPLERLRPPAWLGGADRLEAGATAPEAAA